jgi:outer membrane protein, heavy metal efflux system
MTFGTKIETNSLSRTLALLAISGCSIYHPKPLTTAAVEGDLKVPSESSLRVRASRLKQPALRPVEINLRNGIGPDEAAVLAVLLNPTLRADRDRRGLAAAQLIQAGVLPNPQISYARDYVVGGNTAGTITAFGLSGSWDFTSLITLLPKIETARTNVRSVDLDIAWVEWQAAQAARTALYRVVALEAELYAAQEADKALRESVGALSKAVELHEKTVLDLAAAQSTSQDAQLTALSIQQELAKQRLALNRAMGLPADAKVRVQRVSLPSNLGSPPQAELIKGLESRRLDLLGLKQGYDSQDASLRTAILAQFPKISLGFNRAGDTSNVQTLGFGVTVDIPIFDRNQGNIARERATRQKLFDEYADRLFQARSDVATALSDIRHLNGQIATGEKLVPTLQRLVDTAKSALDQGNADVISYYQTRFNLILRQIEVLKLKQQLIETRIALEIASGRYLPDSNMP